MADDRLLPGQLAWIFACTCGSQAVLDADRVLTRNQAVRELRRCGWSVAAEGECTCPGCASQPRKPGQEVKNDWRPE